MNDDDKSPWTIGNIIAIIGAIFAGLSLCISTWNNTKLHKVEDQQTVQAEKADQAATAAVETKAAVDVKTAKAEKTLDKLASANLPNLYASLLYFEQIAKDPDRTTAERDKARVKAQETRTAIAEVERKNGP